LRTFATAQEVKKQRGQTILLIQYFPLRLRNSLLKTF